MDEKVLARRYERAGGNEKNGTKNVTGESERHNETFAGKPDHIKKRLFTRLYSSTLF